MKLPYNKFIDLKREFEVGIHQPQIKQLRELESEISWVQDRLDSLNAKYHAIEKDVDRHWKVELSRAEYNYEQDQKRIKQLKEENSHDLYDQERDYQLSNQ